LVPEEGLWNCEPQAHRRPVLFQRPARLADGLGLKELPCRCFATSPLNVVPPLVYAPGATIRP
jgi:hypothetical protein